ncbi:FERM and PDZ domain-containing protein 2 [Dendroctonus ponderosae]|uniref:FERM domain-containing protein n=1 Tax=Dendroctonus ponderosae TaxID=77166 RepID=U4U544_DENPD|nr:FERM and PDZ domain-containing protein 2 [Dendroctonus ponderosae]ERL85090.1 hypothetical protein D910_02512 [Dendroctonus ponderosae]
MTRPKSIAWIDCDLQQPPSLEDLLTARPAGLDESETWAILSQSIQALQDLFLSDGASGKHSIPLITPAALHFTARGRVKLTPSSTSLPACKLLNHLAPEYKATKTFSDCEYEKMWIFSLGATLKRAAAVALATSPLWQVLSNMTNQLPAGRSSLMDLLDLMAAHCHDRPFSHVVMDLQQEALAAMETSNELLWGPPAMQQEQKEQHLPRCHAKRRGLKVRCNPLQRVASRLYSVESRPVCLEGACVGPEFVIRAALPARKLVLSASKHQVTVVLLDGQRLEVSCNPASTTPDQLLRLVFAQERIEENFLLGLSALIAGDFVFVPSDTRLEKVLAPGGCLYVRVRFFLPSLRGLRSPQTRHLLYLQLRRSLLEHQLPSPFSQIVRLTALALQAEFGDCDPARGRDYFLLEHYVPETMISLAQDERRLKQELAGAHAAHQGLARAVAEDRFISLAQSLPHYGGHFYSAVWARPDRARLEAWLYINAHGICLYERGRTVSHCAPQLYQSFKWRDIQTLCYSKHEFTVVPRSGPPFSPKYKVKMAQKKSYYAFRLASLHHQFFLELRSQFMSLQALGRQFGVPLSDPTRPVCREERQNKENEKPQEPRRGVKMGTKAFAGGPPRAKSLSLERLSLSSLSFHCSSTSLSRDSEGDAFVLDSTLRSQAQLNILPDFQESISATFQERLDAMSFAEERLLSSVWIQRDSEEGSLGLQVTEGSDGNVYIQAASRTQAVRPGDQVVAVNGLSLLGRKYADSLELMKNARGPVEFVLSRVVSARSPVVGGGAPVAPSRDHDKAVIVEMIPKKNLISVGNGYVKKAQPLAVPRSLGLGRRWNGPVRYPVTPVKNPGEGADAETSEDEQVFI